MARDWLALLGASEDDPSVPAGARGAANRGLEALAQRGGDAFRDRFSPGGGGGFVAGIVGDGSRSSEPIGGAPPLPPPPPAGIPWRDILLGAVLGAVVASAF